MEEAVNEWIKNEKSDERVLKERQLLQLKTREEKNEKEGVQPNMKIVSPVCYLDYMGISRDWKSQALQCKRIINTFYLMASSLDWKLHGTSYT